MPAGPRDLQTKVEAIAHRYPDKRSLTLPGDMNASKTWRTPFRR